MVKILFTIYKYIARQTFQKYYFFLKNTFFFLKNIIKKIKES